MNLYARLQWPKRILGPSPGLKELNLACWGLLLGFVVIPLAVSLWLGFRGASSHFLPVDFIYFYGDGRLVNEYSLSHLYDYALQRKTFNQIYALKDATYGPSPYPPFVALFFSLFARMPFLPAYGLWMSASLAMYLGGIAAAVKGVFPKEPLKTSLLFCFALGFYPFFIGTLKNGQLSAVAVLSVGLAIAWEREQRPFLSGLVLSLLAYKPTLLVLLVPMLLVTRRFKAFGGFLAGSAVLFLVATAFGGFAIWPAFVHFLRFFRQASVVHGQSRLQLWEYIDLGTFTYAIPGGRSPVGLASLFILSAAMASWLAVLLWKSTGLDRPVQSLAWAAALVWTLLLNAYVPIWDSILVSIAVIVTLDALRELDSKDIARGILFLALAIFAVTWNMAGRSNRHGSQLMMVLLFILGIHLLLLLQRAIRTAGRNEPDCPSGEAAAPASAAGG